MNRRAVGTLVLAALVAAAIAGTLVFVDIQKWAVISAGRFWFRVHPALPLAVGMAIGLAAVAASTRLRAEAYWSERDPMESWIPAATSFAVATMCVVVAAAVASDLKPVAAILMLVLGTATLIAAGYTFRLFQQGGSLRFDSNWGGLGGGQGGWRVSPATAMALLLVILLGSTTAIGAAALSDDSKGTERPGKESTEDVADEADNAATNTGTPKQG